MKLDPGGLRMRADARRNRQSLMDAGERVVRAGRGLTVAEVCGEARVGIGTFYRHFPQREDLVAALVAARFRDLVESADRAGADPAGALVRWLSDLMTVTAVYRDAADIVMAALAAPDGPIAEDCAALHATLAALVERAAGRPVDPSVSLDVLRAATALAWSEGDPTDIADSARRWAAILVHGALG